MNKEQYLAPAIEVIKLDSEGTTSVIPTSGGGSINKGEWPNGEFSRSNYVDGGFANDVEEMVNNLFTVQP